MPYNQLPTGTVARPDHPTQKSLDLLDAGLVLAQDSKTRRYEIWRRELTRYGVLYTGILPVVGPDGATPVDPGDWLIEKLRARDSRYRPAKEAAAEVLKEIHEQEAADAIADDNRLDAVREEVIKDYLPLWRQKADPHYEGRRYTHLEKKPVIFTPKDVA